jgi:alpha/beta superfamily hydrolase
MSAEDDLKSLSTFVHWPNEIPMLTSPPTVDQVERRIVALILHPWPKMGGNAHNNVVDFLSNMFTNGYYLSYTSKHDKSQQLYDVSYMGPDFQRTDLKFNSEANSFSSQRDGPLTRQYLPNPYDHITSNSPNTSPSQISPKPNGIITIRFNTSGVEDSDGTSTWFGSTEVDDVITILRWIFHPQSKMFPTDLFLVGYSFGGCLLGSALNRIFQSNARDSRIREDEAYGSKSLLRSYQSLAQHLSNTLRGTTFLAYPAGFFSRCLLGSHISQLRSLSTYLCQHELKEGQQPMMYFILDQDDEITSPQTLVDIISGLPYPAKPKEKQQMLQLLATKTGHSFRGKEHILALLLSTYFCKSISFYDKLSQTKDYQITSTTAVVDHTKSELESSQVQNRKKQKSDVIDNKNTPQDQNKTKHNSTKTIVLPPLPLKLIPNPAVSLHEKIFIDDFVRVFFYDMNLWIPLVIMLAIFGKILYSRYEFQIKEELDLVQAAVAVVSDPANMK